MVDLISRSFLLAVDPCLSLLRAFISMLMEFYSSDFCGKQTRGSVAVGGNWSPRSKQVEVVFISQVRYKSLKLLPAHS